MSSIEEHRADGKIARGVIVFTKDRELVKSISGTFEQHALASGLRDYVVIQQTSTLGFSSSATASVLDIDLLDGDAASISGRVQEIKKRSGDHPLVLVGESASLDKVMQISEVRELVDQSLPRPVSGQQVLSVLSLVKQRAVFKQQAKSLQDSVYDNKASKRRKISATVAGLLAVVGLAAFYLFNESTHNLTNYQGASVAESALNLAPQNGVAEIETSDATDTSKLAMIAADGTLFNTEASMYVERGRQALKQGYIVGPKDVNALHFFQLALNVDPLSEKALARKDVIVMELAHEFSLAIKLGKYGRSDSILKVMTAIDPLNQGLLEMRDTKNLAFRASQ